MIANTDTCQIPRIIWQTAKSTTHSSAVNLINTWKSKNPNYQYNFMNDVQCDQFIKDNFSSEFYAMYCSLPIGVMRADVWRVAVVYIYGGVYADIDCECVVPLDTWVDEYSLIISVETENGELANFFFAAKPKHPALLSVLNRLVELAPNNDSTYHNLFVQNFGQYGFSDGVLKYFGLNDPDSMSKGGTSNYYNLTDLVKKDNARFFIKSEQRVNNHIFPTTYVAHYVASQNWIDYDSWRKHQYVISKPSKAKPIKFITTFSKVGYEVYGKSWIKTFTENVIDKNISADIYVDFKIPKTKRINFIDFNKAIPSHKQWSGDFSDKFQGEYYPKMMGLRFSFKSFVMIHALENNSDCYIIWLDGDCIFKPNQDFSKIIDVLNGNAIAVQREHNGGEDHCESGFVLFDVDHPNLPQFLHQFKTNYQIDNIKTMGAPYDGFLIYKSLNNIPYMDLNDGYGRGGIQSDPNETFLHPELNKRFVHNIGPTGKNSYPSWEKYSTTDEFFNLITSTSSNMTSERINDQRKHLLNIRLVSRK